MQIHHKECFGGFKIEMSPFNKIILSATSGENKISLNDIVCSSGRAFCPKGTQGRVVEIDEPFANGTTDHIFLIDFGTFGFYYMGFVDLVYSNGTYIVPPVLKNVDYTIAEARLN
jgi:hypothetical protein